MKKALFALAVLIVALVATFFLNTDFRNFVINVGASKTPQEALHQLGMSAPPLIVINSVSSMNETNNTTISNQYILMILNTNDEASDYQFRISDKRFKHTIHQDIHLSAHEKKTIRFNVYASISSIVQNQKFEPIEVEVIDKNNPDLISKKTMGFIIQSM